jgi:Fic family protein
MHIQTCRPSLLPVKNLKWERLIPLIGDAREAVARLDAELLLDKKSLAILEPLRWKEAMSSLRSQNIKADFLELLRYKSAKLAPEERAALMQKIIAAKEGLETGIRWGRRRKIGEHFFCRIHACVKRNGAASKDIGRIRDRQNWIGKEGCGIEEAYFYPPAAKRVRPLLRNLEAYLSKSDFDPLVQMAIAFAQLLIIHPFMDGNGRVARVFIPVFAAKKKLLSEPALFLSAYFDAHRLDYFHKLFWISEKKAWEDWIVYFLKGVIMQADTIRQRMHRLRKLWEKTAKIAGPKKADLLFHEPLLKRPARMDRRLLKQKILIAQGEDYVLFEPLIRAMRI